MIVIPGILGSELINSEDRRDCLAVGVSHEQEGLPISPDLDANRDDLVPGKIVETVKLARVLAGSLRLSRSA